ncbi:5-methylcytosine-specific restriction endonuclease system specificity protein McrC [Alkalihalobacillus hwajinpoensis]|uniref:5-methylcytosine-specific restriction endonuclease system specificity protein McrC n=1 Tax=Guptibacillus hwajinpoensis TaxID=208199 RepID=UPI001884498E|nr:5-methylcytosine-specific restriction endonuclease system specificity protein McrC [Pseudalkalibacillus hwajinpoensis]MBF0707722.1 5-methylcytosine-specific restriction endonuclease system specificity protein McrC [Pseudalkalibacillus hwajinpoensis]
MSSLAESSKIPIKNLYYMLCYSWDHLSEIGEATVAGDDDKDLPNLLTRILIGKLRSLIKRGFYREYVELEEEASTLRGKVLFSESIATTSFKRGKMHILYEEMSHDILHNQLIKATLLQLVKMKELDDDLRKKVSKLTSYFHEVTPIKLNRDLFKNIKLHRSNRHYRFVLDICQFLMESSLLIEEGQTSQFADFYRDPREMAMLFENFVRNFYRNELPFYQVSRETIYWQAEGNNDKYLPRMQTDITLKDNERKIIIDTKYYQHTLTSNYGSQKVHSGNLYQLYAYLNNQQSPLPTMGMLLYPEVNHTLDLNYQIQGHRVQVCTVDLNMGWRKIHERLINIVTQ